MKVFLQKSRSRFRAIRRVPLTLLLSILICSSLVSLMPSQAVEASGYLSGNGLVGVFRASILDQVVDAVSWGAEAVDCFYGKLVFGSPCMTTNGPGVSATPSATPPAGAGAKPSASGGATSPLSFSSSQLLGALRELLRQGLPPDIAQQLQGPQGAPGPAGVQGPTGYSIGSVYPSTNNTGTGSLGGVTYFGSKEITTQTLTTTGNTTLAQLSVTGAASLTTLNVSGATTLANFTVSALDVAGNGSVSGTFEATTLKGDGQQITLARLAGSTYSTVQHLQDVYHSTGYVSGGGIVDGGSGNITVATGTGLIRGLNSSLSTLSFFDWPASGSFTLTNNATNYIYIDYNAGTPKVHVQLTEETSDYHSKFLLAKVVRVGTTLYMNEVVKPTVGDHAGLMIRQMQQVMPYGNATGGEIMAATVNPRAFMIMAGTWWEGLNYFSTGDFDGDSDTFSYFYRSAGSGWTEATGSTQIDNANYDNASGTLAALDAGDYGVHWVYMDTNGTPYVVYGSRSYTLNEAQNAAEPTSLPVQIDGAAFIIGRIIIQKGAATFTQVDSVSMMRSRFSGGAVPDHNSLVSLQGGTTDQYYHQTVAQHDRWASGSASLALMADCSNGTASKLLYNPTTGVFSCGVDQNTVGGGGGGSVEFREFRAGGFDSVPASVSFSANGFNLTASGSSDVLVAIDYTNGPASRSIAQTISGAWTFTAASNQFSNTLEIGTASVSSATISSLTLPNGLTVGTLGVTALTVSGQTLLANASASGNFEGTSMVLGSGGYLNFGATLGSVSYGLRDLAGVVQVKNSAGIWRPVSTTSTLAGLSDVSITAPESGQRLVYNSSTGLWNNEFPYDVVTHITTATYTIASASGVYFVDTSGASVTITIPDSVLSNDGKAIRIFKITSDANTVTVQTTGGQLIGSAATAVISQNNKGFSLISDYNGGSSSGWRIIQDSRFLTGGTDGSLQYWNASTGAWTSTGSELLFASNTFTVGSLTTFEVQKQASIASSFFVTSAGLVGIGTSAPTDKLSVVGATSDTSANALGIKNATGSAIFTVRNDGVVMIGTTDPNQSSLRLATPVLHGAETLSTVGSSTTVTTTNNAFANVYPFTKITANGVSRNVVTKTDSNTVVVDSAVDWSAGYSFTYKKSINMSFDAPDDDVSRALTFTRGTTTDWTLLNRKGEAGQNFYIRNGITGKDTLTITEKGTMALNLPSTLASASPNISGTFVVYPQAFDKVWASVSGTFYDVTTNAANSQDTPTPFTVTANTDYLYLGALRKFSNTFLERSTGPTTGVLKAEYWNGSVWVTIGGAMGFSDGSLGFTQSGTIAWRQTALTNWTTRAVNGSSSLYYVRLSFTTYIGGALRIDMIIPNAANRLDIFKAPGDSNPAFEVSGLGRASLGDRLRSSRTTDTVGDEEAALTIVDSQASLRLWAFDASSSAEIQLIAGTGSVSDNLNWGIELASVSGPYGTDGLLFHRHNGVNEIPLLTLNNTNSAATSAVGATFGTVFGDMDGNDLMRGIFLNYTNGTHSGTGNEVRAIDVSGISPSANASESAIVIGPGWDYAFIASQGNVGIGTETPNYRLEVGGTASISQMFGSGLSTCNASNDILNYDSATGLFSCREASTMTDVPLWIHEEGSAYFNAASLSFRPSGFNVTDVSGDAMVAIDYLNGPASRSIAQIITGAWNFANGASISALEVSGALTASGSFNGAGLSTCNGATQKLTWIGGMFGCGVDQNTGGGGATGTIEIREFGGAFDSTPASVSFAGGQFNLTASGSSDVTISLDWGAGGPASLSQNEIVTGTWQFTNLTAGHLGITSASVSGVFEAAYASVSQTFGSGLTNCSGAFQFLKWTAATGLFSCASEGGGVRTESSGTTVIEDNTSINFDSGRFSVTASGATETNVALNLAEQWTFTGGASVSTNPFEVGTNTLYVNPTTNRVGINTQNLSEALEIVGNASISGSLYAGSAVGIGTTSPTSGYVLDAVGAARFGNGSHASQTLMQFNVGHAMTLSYSLTQFGQATMDGLQIGNANTSESNIFTVYASQGAQYIANSQGSGYNVSLIAMSNPNMANLSGATQGLFTNKATTHDIAIQYSYGGAAPIDAILLDVDPAANTINNIIINNDNGNVPFRVAGQLDANLLYVNGTSRVGIGTSAPLTKLEVQGTASASHLLTTGGLQVAGGASASYSRFGTSATTHALSATNDLLVSGGLEVDGRTFFDSSASVALNFEVSGTASISGMLYANGGLTLTGALAIANASVSNNLEVTGTASISGRFSLWNSASVSQNIEAGGYASASKYFGAGLKDCDNTNQKMLWTASGSDSGKFSCGYDNNVNNVQVFSAGAAQTWTRPASVSQVYVEVWGAGGGGGTSSGNNQSDGGGGGGAYSAGLVTVTGNVTVNVGTGGTANGGTGGNSSFAGATTPTADGGTGTTTATGGAGGTATGGTINLPGQKGANGAASDGAKAGDGGSSPMGGAGGMGHGGQNAAGGGVSGEAGQIPGGGGGGGEENGGLGAAGADGRVIVWAYTGTSRADIAEWYETDGTPVEGDVVTMTSASFTYKADTGMHTVAVLTKARPGDKVFGVVSTHPEIYMGKDVLPTAQHPQPIALAGRVPVSVSTLNGPIKKGDLLRVSMLAGVAERTDKAGQIIGAAMEDYDGPVSAIGKVMMLVQTGFSTGARLKDVMARQGIDIDAIPENVDVGKVILAQMLQNRQNIQQEADISEVFSDRIVAGLEVITPRVVADALVIDSIEAVEKDISVKLGEGGAFSISRGASGSIENLFTIGESGDAFFRGALSANSLNVAQLPQLAGLVGNLDALASRSSALEQLVADTAVMLTGADVQLAQSVASQSAQVELLKQRIETAELNLATLASASQALTFSDSVMFNGGLRVDSISSIGDLLTFGGDTYFFGRPYFTADTGGFAVIRAGTKEVRIAFDRPYLEAPIVNATLLTTASQSVDDLLATDVRFAIASASGDGFTIRLAKNAVADVRLNWTALAVHDARTVFSIIPVVDVPVSAPVESVADQAPTETPTETPVETTTAPSESPVVIPEPSDVPVVESSASPPAEATPEPLPESTIAPEPPPAPIEVPAPEPAPEPITP